MKRLAAKFEALVEHLLTGNLQRHIRILSWVALSLVVACIVSLIWLFQLEIPLASGMKLPLNELLFPNRP